jgi:hypothetical protein
MITHRERDVRDGRCDEWLADIPGQRLGDAPGGMIGDTGDDVAEIGLGVEAV